MPELAESVGMPIKTAPGVFGARKVLLPISLVRPKHSPAFSAREVISRCDSRGIPVPPSFRQHARLLAQLEADDALLYAVTVDGDGYAVSVELASLDVSLAAWAGHGRA